MQYAESTQHTHNEDESGLAVTDSVVMTEQVYNTTLLLLLWQCQQFNYVVCLYFLCVSARYTARKKNHVRKIEFEN